MSHFDGDASGFFYFTSDLDPPLIARRIDYGDNVIPSANSIMARNLVLWENYWSGSVYSRGQRMFNRVWPRLKKDGQPSFYSNWCQLMLTLIKPPFEIAIVGSAYDRLLDEIQRTYQPDAVYLGGPDSGNLPLLQYKHVEGETLIYVCQNKTCKRPVETVADALTQMNE
ncbi:MAG: hypothetical protein IPL92_06615 [Saprospiraceae bacterium]|nr:hypothetical protein [Candidatus Opimibacter iunctus]